MFGFDLLFLFAGWAAGQLVFGGYESHVTSRKRLAKLVIMTLVFGTVRLAFGRRVFFGLLGLMTAGMVILHGYWFHHRHGIHWRTAEPRDRYLQLIGQ